jgi:hypothetical protein
MEEAISKMLEKTLHEDTTKVNSVKIREFTQNLMKTAKECLVDVENWKRYPTGAFDCMFSIKANPVLSQLKEELVTWEQMDKMIHEYIMINLPQITVNGQVNPLNSLNTIVDAEKGEIKVEVLYFKGNIEPPWDNS